MKEYGQTSEDNQDSGVLSNPLSFVHSGYYNWPTATATTGRGTYGDLWVLQSADLTSRTAFDFNDFRLRSRHSDHSGYGLAARCVQKSFTTLINTSYSMKNNEQTEENNRDSGLLSNPLSFLRSGNFDWLGATLTDRGGGGSYWSLHSANTTRSYYLAFGGTYLNPQNYYYRSLGLAVRLRTNPSPLSLILAIL